MTAPSSQEKSVSFNNLVWFTLNVGVFFKKNPLKGTFYKFDRAQDTHLGHMYHFPVICLMLEWWQMQRSQRTEPYLTANHHYCGCLNLMGIISIGF